MTRAEHLLACAVTYREAPTRDQPLAKQFGSAVAAVDEMVRVLLHEAREAMQTPLADVPEQPYLHPVDVDTDEPGIVDTRDELRVLRVPSTTVPRVTYGGRRRPHSDDPPPPPAPRVHVENRVDAEETARKASAKALKKAETSAAAVERRAAKTAAAREARASETPEERSTRLAEAKRKRDECKERKKERSVEEEAPQPAPKPVRVTLSEEALLVPDATVTVPPPRRKRRKDDPAHFFEHALPHHRHLSGLAESDPHVALLPALLRGEACDGVEVVQGPPGTGKTRALVARAAEHDVGRRLLLCAPTNVGAANLYTRCLEVFGDEVALVVPPERVPVGTVVLSNDPSRRVVCATVSSRAGPMLHDQHFDAVFVDEAAQCMEAWVWTLLRSEVSRLVLAGDVHQLPAQTSESGRDLGHDRSLMERLVSLGYANAVTLTTQHRMAPELLAFPNREFYAGALVCGAHAPSHGEVVVVDVSDGCEEESGTSWRNRAEAVRAAEVVVAEKESNHDCILLAPYSAQVRLLHAQKTGCEVHTVDSFQGREADVVVLSVVRTQSHLGFWSDPRRLTVALTRARRKLIVVCNGREWPTHSPLGRLWAERV